MIFLKKLFAILTIIAISYTSQYLVNAMPLVANNKSLSVNQLSSSKKLNIDEVIVWAQVCSCRSYYGVPHTCYYSSISDYDSSCYSKCVREANQ